MKVTETNKKTVFEPIEIKLVIETKDELFALWHRLNISFADVIKNSSYKFKEMDRTGCDTNAFRRILEKCVIDRGYKLDHAYDTESCTEGR